jgi:pentapeptide MXKDX repeat protein
LSLRGRDTFQLSRSKTMSSTSRLAAAILSVGLIMQFGMAAATDDMKKDTMGKDGHAMQKDAMAGDCPDQAAMGKDKTAMANDKMAGDGMKKDAMGHDAMAAKDTMKKGATGKDCTPGAMKKDGKDAMGHDAMKK